MKNIKRGVLFFLILCISITTISSSSAKEIQDKNDTIILRYAELRSKTHPLSLVSKYFAKRVLEESDGRIKIKVYYDGQLGSNQDVLTQLQFGGIALGRVSLLELSELVKSIQYDFSYLILQDNESIESYVQENRSNFIFALQCEKIFPLSVLPSSQRCLFSDEKNLATLEQISKLTVGINESEMYQKLIQQYCSKVVYMGDAENYSSLRNGFIEARESSLATFMESGVYPFINNITIIEDLHIPSFIIASNDVITTLSLQDRMILEKCSNDANIYAKELLKSYETTAINRLIKEKDFVRLP